MDMVSLGKININAKELDGILNNLELSKGQKNQIKKHLQELSKNLNLQPIDDLNSLFKTYYKKSDSKFISDLKEAVNNDFSKIKSDLSEFANSNLTKIKAINVFEQSINRNKFNAATSELTIKAINEFNSRFSNFISLSVNGKDITASLNVINLMKLSPQEVQSKKLGKIPVSSIVKVFENNNINKVNVNKQILEGFRSKSIIDQSNALNMALGKEVINPVVDVNDAVNLIASSFCKLRPRDAISEEETSGRSSILFTKGPTASAGKIEAYNFNMSLGYMPLNGAGIQSYFSGSIVKFNFSKQTHIQKGLDLTANFSVGAAIVKGDASLIIGDYSEKLYSLDKIIPVASAEVGFNYNLNKDILVRSSVSFFPGVNTSFENNKFKFTPNMQNNVFASISVKI
ncbi:MAG: hypothetical protein QXW80_02360 [Candidatus Micrarchaeia archaeon]